MKIKIPDFSKAKVLVVGDLMLDRYWYGSTSRISPEAPVPVVSVQNMDERPGGAGNVAMNIASLGGSVDLVGMTGEDELGATLMEKLRERRVNCLFVKDRGRNTITKLRVISQHQQLIRLDFEENFSEADPQGFHHSYENALNRSGVVVLSDYGKGTLGDVRQLIQMAAEQRKIVIVDPKGADFSKYRDAGIITPNMAEFEAVVGRCDTEDAISEKGKALISELNLYALLITRSERGMTLLRLGHEALHFPARAREVYDVTGAGDTVVALVAAGLAAGMDLPDAVALANLAAGIVVGKLGTGSVTIQELQSAMDHTQESGRIVTENELLKLIAESRARGERIVFTNGCFDILHAGHVSFLQKASGVGDRLVVAVNDDESVRRLKGNGRPVVKLPSRAAVLAALGCVDWVISFSEDTPARLIESLSPDILVKGIDYKPDEIAGADHVRRTGGQVVLLDSEQDITTSRILAT